MKNEVLTAGKSGRKWLSRSWYTLPRIVFIVGCCVFFALASFTIITDDRGFGCSISVCLDTQDIDQSRPFDPTIQEPSIKDTFSYVTFNPILTPSLFFVRLVLPEQIYQYTPIGSSSFFIDRANESFTFHTYPNVVISDTDEHDIKNITNTIHLLSLANIPIWLLYGVGMTHLAQRKPKLWYLWSVILLIIAILAIVSAQFSAEHFG